VPDRADPSSPPDDAGARAVAPAVATVRDWVRAAEKSLDRRERRDRDRCDDERREGEEARVHAEPEDTLPPFPRTAI